MKIDFTSYTVRRKWLRILLLFFIFKFTLDGLGILVVASWMISTRMQDCQFLAEYNYSAYIHLSGAIAILIFIMYEISIFKRGGNMYKLAHFLWIFGVIFWLQMAAIIVSTVQKRHIELGELRHNMEKTFDSQSRGAHIQCWDMVQKTYSCCGVDDVSSWVPKKTNTSDRETVLSLIPESCQCDSSKKKNKHTCLEYLYNQTIRVHDRGCYNELLPTVDSKLEIVQIMGSILLAVQTIHYLITLKMTLKLQNKTVVGVIDDTDIRNMINSHERDVDDVQMEMTCTNR